MNKFPAGWCEAPRDDVDIGCGLLQCDAGLQPRLESEVPPADLGIRAIELAGSSRLRLHRIVMDDLGDASNARNKLNNDYEYFEMLRKRGQREPIMCRPIGRYTPGKNPAGGPPQSRAQFVIIRQVAQRFDAWYNRVVLRRGPTVPSPSADQALPTRSRQITRVHKRRFRRSHATKSTP